VLGGDPSAGSRRIGGYLLGDQLGLLGDGPSAAPVSPQAGPTVTPSPSPSPSPRPPPRGRLLIHGTGVVNLDPSYIPNLAANGHDYAWSGLGGLFRDDDLTVVNLECPASDLGSPLDKQFVFRCDPAALDEPRRAGGSRAPGPHRIGLLTPAVP
jgi:Bacterial capsule synthesis protein PGA_cap